MSVKHDIACQLVLILSHSKERALLMINYYYYYNHFGSSRGGEKRIQGVYLEIKCPVSPLEHLGKKGSWYLQRPRKQLREDKSSLGRRGCETLCLGRLRGEAVWQEEQVTLLIARAERNITRGAGSIPQIES